MSERKGSSRKGARLSYNREPHREVAATASSSTSSDHFSVHHGKADLKLGAEARSTVLTAYNNADTVASSKPLKTLRESLATLIAHPEMYGGNIRELIDTELMHVMYVCSSASALSNAAGSRVPVDVNPQYARLLPPVSRVGGRDAAGNPIGSVAEPLLVEELFASSSTVVSSGLLRDESARNKTSFPLLTQKSSSSSHTLPGSERGEGGLGGSHLTSHASTSSVLGRGQRSNALDPELARADGKVVAAETETFELTFLRSELRRVAALLNSSTIRSQELSVENKTLRERMSSSNSTMKQYERQVREMEDKMSAALRDAAYASARERQSADALLNAEAELKKLRQELNSNTSRHHQSASISFKQTESNAAAGDDDVILEGPRDTSTMAMTKDAQQRAGRSVGATRLARSMVGVKSSPLQMDGIGGDLDGGDRRAEMRIRMAYDEIERVTQSWRDTERTYQETNRRLENAEHEIVTSHSHLEDAFHLIERLERRLARRDRGLARDAIRHTSFQEKYSKLRWCAMELATLTGVYSCADAFLSSNPDVWLPALFVRLHRHKFHYSTVTEATFTSSLRVVRSNAALTTILFDEKSQTNATPLLNTSAGDSGGISAAAKESASACAQFLFRVRQAFVPSPLGGQFMGPTVSGELVGLLRLLIENAAAGYDPDKSPKDRERTNLQGVVACRALRWDEPHSIDYLGGVEKIEDCALTRNTIPLLTLASVLVQPSTKVFPNPLLLRLFDKSAQELLASFGVGRPAGGEASKATGAAAGGAGKGKKNTGQGASAAGKGAAGGADAEAGKGEETSTTDKLNLQRTHVRQIVQHFWTSRYRQYIDMWHSRCAPNAKRMSMAASAHSQINSMSDARLSLETGGGASSTSNGGASAGHGQASGHTGRIGSIPSFPQGCASVDTFLTAFVTFVDAMYPCVPQNIDDDDVEGMSGESGSKGLADKRSQGVEGGGGSEQDGTARRDHEEAHCKTVVATPLSPSPLCGEGKGAEPDRRVRSASKADNRDGAGRNRPPSSARSREHSTVGRFHTAGESTTGSADFAPSQVLPSVHPPGNLQGRFVFAQWATLDDLSGSVPLSHLSSRAKEVLRGVYLFAMEYKEVDAELRLFYLVAQQLIPESVAINFYCALQAIQNDCESHLVRSINWEDASTSTSTQDRKKEKVGDRTANGRHMPYFESVPSDAPHLPNQTASLRNTASRVDRHSARQDMELQENILCRGGGDSGPGAKQDEVEGDACPIELMQRVMEYVDRVPLSYENVEMEPDSEGEGYGTVFSSKREPQTVQPDSSRIIQHNIAIFLESTEERRQAAEQGLIGRNLRHKKPGSTFRLMQEALNQTSAETSEGDESSSSSVEEKNGLGSADTAKNPINEETQVKPGGGGGGGDGVRDNLVSVPSKKFQSAKVRDTISRKASRKIKSLTPWVKLQDIIDNNYGSCRPFLASVVPDTGSSSSFIPRTVRVTSAAQQRLLPSGVGTSAAHMAQPKTLSRLEQRQLAATRGLLPVETVLRIIWKHALAIYAASVGGGERHDEVHGQILRNHCVHDVTVNADMTTSESVNPLQVVGRTAPNLTPMLRRRLRFALSLDQSSALINPTQLFAAPGQTDGALGASTHLFDELLSIILDVHQSQQHSWVDGVLVAACRSQHEMHENTGMEECNGNVPVRELHKYTERFLRRCARPYSEPEADRNDEPDNNSDEELSAEMERSITVLSWQVVHHVHAHTNLMKVSEDYQARQFVDIPVLLLPTPEDSATTSSVQNLENSTSLSRLQQQTEESANTLQDQDGEQAAGPSVSLHLAAYVLRMTFFVWGDATLACPLDSFIANTHGCAESLFSDPLEKGSAKALTTEPTAPAMSKQNSGFFSPERLPRTASILKPAMPSPIATTTDKAQSVTEKAIMSPNSPVANATIAGALVGSAVKEEDEFKKHITHEYRAALARSQDGVTQRNPIRTMVDALVKQTVTHHEKQQSVKEKKSSSNVSIAARRSVSSSPTKRGSHWANASLDGLADVAGAQSRRSSSALPIVPERGEPDTPPAGAEENLSKDDGEETSALVAAQLLAPLEALMLAPVTAASVTGALNGQPAAGSQAPPKSTFNQTLATSPSKADVTATRINDAVNPSSVSLLTVNKRRNFSSEHHVLQQSLIHLAYLVGSASELGLAALCGLRGNGTPTLAINPAGAGGATKGKAAGKKGKGNTTGGGNAAKGAMSVSALCASGADRVLGLTAERAILAEEDAAADPTAAVLEHFSASLKATMLRATPVLPLDESLKRAVYSLQQTNYAELRCLSDQLSRKAAAIPLSGETQQPKGALLQRLLFPDTSLTSISTTTTTSKANEGALAKVRRLSLSSTSPSASSAVSSPSVAVLHRSNGELKTENRGDPQNDLTENQQRVAEEDDYAMRGILHTQCCAASLHRTYEL